jgi:hypothetical protein
MPEVHSLSDEEAWSSEDGVYSSGDEAFVERDREWVVDAKLTQRRNPARDDEVLKKYGSFTEARLQRAIRSIEARASAESSRR